MKKHIMFILEYEKIRLVDFVLTMKLKRLRRKKLEQAYIKVAIRLEIVVSCVQVNIVRGNILCLFGGSEKCSYTHTNLCQRLLGSNLFRLFV